MSLDRFSTEDLAKMISPSSEAFLELKKRGVLRTKNVVGELGEFYAVDFYNKNSKLPNLSFAPTTVQNIDAISRKGETYSIKTISSKNGSTGSFWNKESIDKNEKKFDFLLIVILNQEYGKEMILELSWKDFFEHKKFNKRMNNYNISVTKKLLTLVKIIYEKE